MGELVLGAVIGAAVSVVIAELYHRRNSSAMRKTILRFEELYDDLWTLANRAAEDSEQARIHAHDAWRAGVAGTPEDPEFPYK